jgi:hypothetical protein
MEVKRSIFLAALAFSLLAFASAREAGAALGEPAHSVSSDRIALSAERPTETAGRGFTVQEFEANGTLIREYISPSGIVFAVAWNGYTYPDLTTLLGSYAGEYKEALRQAPKKPGIQRRQSVETGRVVVEKWGHMRNLQGRAYVPALVPPEVDLNEIK